MRFIYAARVRQNGCAKQIQRAREKKRPLCPHAETGNVKDGQTLPRRRKRWGNGNAKKCGHPEKGCPHHVKPQDKNRGELMTN